MIKIGNGTKIKWRDLYGLSLKEGIIVKEIHTYSGRTPDNKYGVRIDLYNVAESDTGFIYDVREKDITLVNVDGKWVDYKLSKLSNVYRRDPEAENAIKEQASRGFINPSYKPKKVIFNDPATIVMWLDGTKTIVKRREGEPDDREKAIMYCILKKLCGNKAVMDKYLKLFLKEEESNEEKEEAGSCKSNWKKPRVGSVSGEGTV